MAGQLNITNVIARFLAPLILAGCAPFGSSPDAEQQARFIDSPQFNTESQRFENRRPNVIEDTREEAFNLAMIYEFFIADRPDGVPVQPLPQVTPQMAEFMAPSDDLKIIWFGHSTFLLNFNEKTVLVDPMFSNSAAPVSFAVKRFQPPVIGLDDLPPIDFILISHDHYDHLDMKSVQYFRDQAVTFITPLGVGSHLQGWGINAANIIERDWWDSIEFDGLEFIAAPAQHFSGRSLTDENKTLWASWIVRDAEHNVYFSGDTGYDTHFKAIGEQYGPFDVAFIESGQYNQAWKAVHLLPEEGVQAYQDLKAKRFFPIHWAMFELALHPWYEPVERLDALSAVNNVNLMTPKIGQITTVNSESGFEKWWKALITKAPDR